MPVMSFLRPLSAILVVTAAPALAQPRPAQAVAETLTLSDPLLQFALNYAGATQAQFEGDVEGWIASDGASVQALLALDPDPRLPAMKAIGVPEIAAMLAGEMTRETAVERAVIATRQYAKRQRTWFRNRMGDWTWIDPLAR